jgi:hypothetical protein
MALISPQRGPVCISTVSWSNGLLEIPNIKSQIANKSQLPKFEITNGFNHWIL